MNPIELPPFPEATSDEDSARGILRLVLSGEPGEYLENPLGCPNCLGPFESQRTPYCGPLCKEENAFVRQIRSGILTGAIADPEKQVAYGQKLWHVLGAGYPLRRTMVTDKGLAQVLKRTSGVCELCGSPAVTVDHSGSG